MRKSHRCPKCKRRDIVFVPRILDRSGGETHPLALWVGVKRKTERGKDKLEYDAPFGQLEAYVCRQCGYTELYVASVEQLKLEDLPGAVVLAGPDPEGPYR
jgi:predicted nucleic-acid-binding Zn-ribbon protein